MIVGLLQFGPQRSDWTVNHQTGPIKFCLARTTLAVISMVHQSMSANLLSLDGVTRHIQQLHRRLITGATAVAKIVGQSWLDIGLARKLDQFQQLDHPRGRYGGNSLKHIEFLKV